MKTTSTLAFATLLLAVQPALAQDWLAPLQELADQLTAPQKPTTTTKGSGVTRPTAPKAPVVERPIVAPVAPPIPQPRPDFADQNAAPDAEAAPAPQATPAETPAEATVADEAVVAAPEEPARVYQGACPALLQGQVEGKMLPPIAEGQCAIQSPLEITAVLSRGRMVPFSAPVITDCAMASALPGWVARVDGYAQAMLDSGLQQINTGPGYMCRNRNNAAAGLVSEHGFANALDIGGFTLEDGKTVAVKTSWLPGNLPEGRLLRLAHDAACGSFTTVLGPEANAEHDDHIHLDLGCHGQSCTALLCQ